ncbi:hypothetical protein CFP56_026249 [Quercus suber]|uniref:Replication factor A C-terminal domain-containing protein n=1 Tax=Quercus suber TaxID=58331 RepID=A0AAW0K1B5_QUESU
MAFFQLTKSTEYRVNKINHKQLEPELNGYKEQHYNQRKEPPLQQKEAIQVQVQDETGSTTFILFDKGAEKIISKTTKEFAKMQEETLKLDENILPKEIQKIIGNEYLFQLHLDEYNMKYGK